MYIITPKKELMIRIFCVVILLVLNIAIFAFQYGKTCNDCIINFISYDENLIGSTELFLKYDIKAVELYDGLVNDVCVIEFSELGGWIYFEDKEEFMEDLMEEVYGNSTME